MPTLNIYDKSGIFIESHQFDGSLLEWIKSNCSDYRKSSRPPYSALKNGDIFHYSNHDVELNSTDIIDLTIEAGWQAVPYIIAIVAAAYSYYVASNLPQGYEDSTGTNNSIYSVGARANAIKPSGIIREMAGQIQVFPDLICKPHRKYVDNQEYLYLNMCVTRGYASILPENIYIAETPAINYSSDVSIQISEPSEDISANIASQNWIESKEVQGIRLVTTGGPILGSWTFDIVGDSMTSYLDGVVAPFPLQVEEDFSSFSLSTPELVGFFRVVSISGASSEIAVVDSIDRSPDDIFSTNILQQQTLDSLFPTVRDVSYISAGSPAFPAVLGADANLTSTNGASRYFGPYSAIPASESCQYAEVDIRFPRGLGELDDENNIQDYTVLMDIEWREVGGSLWNVVSLNFTNATLDETAFTVDIDFGSMINPQFRFRRITKDSDSLKIYDITEVVRIKCLLDSPVSYADITTLQMTVRGGSELSSSSEDRVNIRGGQRKLPTLDEIELAANGTPYDISASNTVVTSDPWDIEFSRLFYVDTVDDEFSRTVSGLDYINDHMLIVQVDEIKTFSLATEEDSRTSTEVSRQNIPTTFSADSCRWGDNGNKIYLSGSNVGTHGVSQYSLSDQYIASSASAPSFYATSEISKINGLYMRDNGISYFACDSDTVYSYSMSAWSITTSSYTGDSIDLSTDLGAGNIVNIFIGNSGSRMYILDSLSIIRSYDLTTSWDITTASLDESFTEASLDGEAFGLWVSGDSLQISGGMSPSISSYSLIRTVDTRATRSAVRFAASAIYDSLGSDMIGQFDFDAMSDLDDTLEAREDYLDADFTDETTLWEALKIILGVGYAEPVIKEGQFTASRIAGGEEPIHLYTPDIMLNDGLQIDSNYYDSQEPDGVDVEFFDIETNSMEVVEFRLSGDLGIKPKRIQNIGSTTEVAAWRHGARERRRLRVKPNNYTFTTELDALNSNYGDIIAIGSDLAGGEYGGVVSASGSDIQLDFQPVLTGSDVAIFRDHEGRASSTHTIVAGATASEITLVTPSTLSFVPVSDENQERTIVAIGSASDYMTPAIVRRISPSGENRVQVTCEEYVESIYSDDNNSPS